MIASPAACVCSFRRRPRAGLSLLELVVVLFIGVLLVALLVVVIGQMRERADRAHCENNLRQMGEAFH